MKMTKPDVSGGPINLNQTVNEVIAQYPKTQVILIRHGLDMCCGGIHPLEMAARAHGVDPEALLRELNAVARENSKPAR